VVIRLRKDAERWSKGGLHPSMPITRVLSWSHLEIALVYLAIYVLLDWVSYIHPIAPFGITPWNPPPGLSFALILLFGYEFLPWLFVAPLLADALVRQLPLPIWAELIAVLIIGLGYGAGASALIHPALRFDVSLATKRDLLLLVAVAAIASAVVALSYAGLVVAIGLLDAQQFAQAALRYWIGDMIGITVVTPFLLVLFTRRRIRVLSWELLAPFGVLLAALWLVMGVAEFRFQLFYLLFLPVIWTAVRFELEGVAAGLAVTQMGLIAAIHLSGQSAIDVVAFQALMIVLAVTGLAVGVLVSEQQRTAHQLRLHQEALARMTRLSSMSEFAAALAHEINQPLTAIANYTKLAKEAAETRSADTSTVVEATAKAAEQVDRAADVVRRLREFIRLGRSESSAVSVGHVIEQAQSLIQTDCEHQGVVLDTHIARELPRFMGDSLQIQQVILNLVRNAMEAILEAGRHDGRITITAEVDSSGFLKVCVRDNGPGFDPAVLDEAVAPFTTTKPDGMGLGLSLCRSIVEAHHGKLAIDGDATGGTVCFTLEAAETPPGRPE
jgi:two-component system, LuxR family, sensor kinase FixL